MIFACFANVIVLNDLSTIPTLASFALQSFLLWYGNVPHLRHLSRSCCFEGKLGLVSLRVFQILSICVSGLFDISFLQLVAALILFRIAVLC